MIGEEGLWELINRCKFLKYKFAGVYAANNFPTRLDQNTFVIVNSDNSDEAGRHWLFYCKNTEDYVFGDPLGLQLRNYPNINKRLAYADLNIKELIDYPLQKPTSKLCGLYCIYIAHYALGGSYLTIPVISETELIRFVTHMQQ